MNNRNRYMPPNMNGCGIQPQNLPSRCALLNSIYEIGFSLDDMILYLDTHPKDTSALNYYHKLHKEYHELVKLYTINYGPLYAKDVHNEKYFSWVDNPMPWEGDM
jgi:spore coat protein JB